MPNALVFNGDELAEIGLRPPVSCNREGILLITNRLKQDGFFKRPEVTQESWCRLVDNLLFYSKTSEQWSDIKGVIVLERCSVRTIPQNEQGHWPFHLVWNDEIRPMHWLQLATFTECDRVGWLEAIQLASHEYVKSHAQSLQMRLKKLIQMHSNSNVYYWKLQRGIFTDLNEVPLCELSLSCDNLLCDSFERLPNSYLVIHIKVNGGMWVKYAVTEVVDNTRNPRFIKTVMFRKNDGLDGETIVRITAKDIRERISNTSVTLGFTTVLLSTIQVTQRFRVALKNCERRTIGYVTLNGWSFETCHKEEGSSLESNETPFRVYCHRRSQSLPITLNVKIKLPSHSDIAEYLFNNICQTTYRLQSDLGCEITVHELMAESKLCYLLPQELLGIWIQHEKEMLQEIICMGEMGLPWKTNQMELLTKHYNLFKYYNSALENTSIRIKKFTLKQSCRKEDPFIEFVPVNLHVQRMWTHDYNLNKSGCYDTITVGAFTAHCQKAGGEGGLFQMVQQNKNTSTPNNISNPVQMANDAVQAIKQLRGEVVDTMSELLSLAKSHQSEGMLPLAERMITNTRALLSLWDSGLVEEALHFIDAHKVSSAFTDNEETLETAKMLSMLKRMNLQLNLTDVITPEVDDFATPCDDRDHVQFLDPQAMSCSPSANYYQPSDEPEPWDLTQLNIEASVMCLVSKVKFLCGHCGSPAVRLRGQNAKMSNNVQRIFVSPNGNDNPINDESVTKIPLDITNTIINSHKESNIHNNNHSENIITKSEKCHDLCNNSIKDGCLSSSIDDKQIPDVIKTPSRKSNRFTDGLNLDDVLDWAAELRPSMRKLRQAMDGLLKGGRLAHAVLRIKQDQNELQQAISLQIRRDICFSQALTSLITGLFCWLWSTDVDVIATLLKSNIGPLCYFEGLLTLHGNEMGMWGDMVIAIEDLQTVAFQLIRWNHRDMPLPKIKGSRASLTIILPVKADLYSKLPNKQDTKFTITPVYFNVGINAMATVAESLGETMPQHKSNVDNYDRLNEYHLRYQKLNFPTTDLKDTCKALPKSKSVEEMIAKMKTLLFSKKSKNVQLLQEASFITRKLNGIRIISCKSGKDRTGMSCTLEQCNILLKDYNLTRQEYRRVLDCMRSEGCRRDNTMKNIGIRKYAFNKVEVMSLPLEYRPPLGTYGSTQT